MQKMSKELKPKICLMCGMEYIPNEQYSDSYCSDYCMNRDAPVVESKKIYQTASEIDSWWDEHIRQ